MWGKFPYLYMINCSCMHLIGTKHMAYWMLYPSPRNRDRGEGEVSLYIFHIMDGS